MSITSVASDRATRGRPWVGTHSVHNALVNNHFLDLLEVHGLSVGAVPDDAYPGYDPAGSHALRMRRLASEFRKQVIGAFARRIGFADVACVSPDGVDGPATQQRELTATAMRERKHMIVGAVFADDARRLIARIPMLLRADVAEELLDVRIAEEGDMEKLYVAVGVKRRPVETNRDGNIRANSLGRVQAEMWLWNRLLTDAQGSDLGAGLVVGLHPKRQRAIQLGAVTTTVAERAEGDETGRKEALFDETVWRVLRVPFGDAECAKGIAALDAIAWRIDVVDEGEMWIASAVERDGSEGTCDEDGNAVLKLAAGANDPRRRPNMKCASMYDAPWAKAKRKVAEKVRELTLVSGISHTVTCEAMAKGVPNDYAHRQVTAAALGVASQFSKTTLEMCKPTYHGPLVKPALIPHNRFNWRRLQSFNKDDHFTFDKSDPELPFADERTFYVDFELASPEYLYTSQTTPKDSRPADDGKYSRFFDIEPSLPLQEDAATDALIFMIGCGQVIDGEWHVRVFTSQTLSITAESAVIREWLEYMHSIMPPNTGQPILNVWGPEQQLLRKALRRMTECDAEAVKGIRLLKTVNVLQVVTTACLTIKGNLSNSLKTVCSSLDTHGLLDKFKQREDEDAVGNGADAMALGLDSAEVACREKLASLADAPKMAQIARYNEADCRDIARVVTYLRKHH